MPSDLRGPQVDTRIARALLTRDLGDGDGDGDTIRIWERRMSVTQDPHLTQIRPVAPRSRGCEECLRIGSPWVHLRLCLTCGSVGCCDSSPNRHARRHASAADHAIVASMEPGEDWRRCYVHETYV